MPFVFQERRRDLVVILGPTASGKTRLGVAVARRFDGEIISADSRQVYRGMDIGSGKDLEEYGNVPVHLIDVVEPGYEFNVYEFQKRFFEAFASIVHRGKLPILVGGTGLYLDAVLKGYRLHEVQENSKLRQELAQLTMEQLVLRLQAVQERLHNNTDLTDRQRLIRAIEIAVHVRNTPVDPLPELNPVVFGLRCDRRLLRERITSRLLQRLEQGMIAEVERLHDSGVPYEVLEFYGLEYRYLARYLKGELSRNDMVQKLNSAIHDFAKRQETWFRRMERTGIAITWLNGDADPLGELLSLIATVNLPPKADGLP